MNPEGPRVAWITNHQAPYRRDLWAGLTKHLPLKVYFLFQAETRRSWSWRPDTAYSSTVLSSRALPFERHARRELDDPLVFLSPLEVWRVVRSRDLLVVGGWEQIAYLQLLVAARLLRIPTILFYESTTTSHRFKRGLIPLARKAALRLASIVVTPGPSTNAVVKDAGVRQSAIGQFTNPIEGSAFQHALDFARPDPQGEGHRFIYVGQLVPRKNVETLIRAFSNYEKASSTLDIVGSGELEQTLRALARDLAIDHRIRWHGYLEPESTAKVVVSSHTLMLTSSVEVWGMTAVEAFAVGLHVILPAHAGAAPLIREEPGVWTWDANDSLVDLMRSSESEWKGPVDSRKRARLLNSEETVEQFLEFFRAASVGKGIDT